MLLFIKLKFVPELSINSNICFKWYVITKQSLEKYNK